MNLQNDLEQKDELVAAEQQEDNGTVEEKTEVPAEDAELQTEGETPADSESEAVS